MTCRGDARLAGGAKQAGDPGLVRSDGSGSGDVHGKERPRCKAGMVGNILGRCTWSFLVMAMPTCQSCTGRLKQVRPSLSWHTTELSSKKGGTILQKTQGPTWMVFLLGSLLAAMGRCVETENTGKRAQLFIVFGIQRSGTTFLSRLASNVDGIRLYHEIFLKKKKQPSHIPDELWSKRLHEPSVFLDGLVDIATSEGLRAVGTVVQPWQLNSTALTKHILRRNDIKYAMIIRNNIFDIYVSAEKSRIAHGYASSHSLPFLEAYGKIKSKPMTLSASQFLHSAETWRKWYHFLINQLMEKGVQPLLITYETLNLGGDMETFYAYLLHAHLGLSNAFKFVGKKTTVKRETGCPSKTVTNMEEFKSQVSQAKWKNDLNPIPSCLA